jgi:malate/lactate dehydrogenase
MWNYLTQACVTPKQQPKQILEIKLTTEEREQLQISVDDVASNVANLKKAMAAV